MTTKWGAFGQIPVYHADPYKDRAEQSDRDKGLAFIATVSRRGKTNDACFDKLKVLYEGEKFVDESRRKLLANAEKRKGMVSDNTFKPPNPMKLSSGLGDFQGTFRGKLPYIAGSPDVKLKKGDIPDGKPNLYTSPGKKGSYGFIKTTLSERKGAGGMHGEYCYAADPYDRARQLEKAAKAKAPKVTEAPFTPANPAKKGGYGWIKNNIGNKAHGFMGEYVYKPQGYGGPRSTDRKIETAFVPPRAPKKGHNCTLGRYPEYLADPEHFKAAARQAAKKSERERLTAGNPWNPPAVPKVGPTRSVVAMNA